MKRYTNAETFTDYGDRPACECCGRWAGWRVDIGDVPLMICRRCALLTFGRWWVWSRMRMADGLPADLPEGL